MRNIILLCLLLLVEVVALGQTTVGFTYDNAGNRITRQIVTLKSTTLTDSVSITRETMGEKNIMLYPNPTGGILIMNISHLKADEKVIIQVTDMTGHILIRKVQNCTNFEIDLTAHPKGFYLLTAVIGKERKEWKIVKE
jgi:hypothetical protein